MRKTVRVLHFSTAFLSVAILACAAFWIVAEPQTQAAPSLTVNGQTIRLEVVSKQSDLAKGLGGRAALDRDAGMLFVLPYRGIHPFWMKGMEFPLDIVWLDDGRVTDVVTLEAPTYANPTPQTYTPRYPADRVLEINAGRAKQLGIVPGVRIGLPR